MHDKIMTNNEPLDFMRPSARRNVPDTQSLQKKILAQTHDMKQEVTHKQELPLVSRVQAWFSTMAQLIASPRAVTITAGLMVFTISASLWMPEILSFSTDPQPQITVVEPFDTGFSGDELSIEELEFQELMLLQDELVFAQL